MCTEYIGQLESEIASRTNEAHELRLQNRTLYEENARLTDLAHMLLSSPHFSSFMDEMSVNGMPQPQATQQQSQQGQQQQQQQQQSSQQQTPQPPQPQPTVSQPSMQTSVPKDANPNQTSQEFQMQQNPQAGMVMVPNQGVDMSTMGLSNGGWNSGIDINYANTPVFAVTEVPQGPAIDTDILSGKSSSCILPEPTKSEIPALERPPMAEGAKQESTGVENPEVEFDESDPAFALFASESPSTSPSQENVDESFEGIQSEKTSPAFELVVQSEAKANEHRFSQLCLSMEAEFERVSMVTSHLL